MAQLVSCEWIKKVYNLILQGPSGVDKIWIACALGHKACRDGYSVPYVRLPRLLEDLALAHGEGRYPKLMNALGPTELLMLDDWGLAPLTNSRRRDLLQP